MAQLYHLLQLLRAQLEVDDGLEQRRIRALPVGEGVLLEIEHHYCFLNDLLRRLRRCQPGRNLKPCPLCLP